MATDKAGEQSTESLWSALSKLESQIVRNPGLPQAYRDILKSAIEELRAIEASTAEQSPEPRQQTCPSCGVFSKSQKFCDRRHEDRLMKLPHAPQSDRCFFCSDPWHGSVGESPAPATLHELVTCDLYQHKVVERNGGLTRLPHEQTSWCVNPERIAPPEPAAAFEITWRKGAYYVSIPNYNGGKVIPLETFTALQAKLGTLEQALRTYAIESNGAEMWSRCRICGAVSEFTPATSTAKLTHKSGCLLSGESRQ